jgi:predicted HicB family RNase H-like nuclease
MTAPKTKPNKNNLSRLIQVRVTPKLHREIHNAAARDEMPVSIWLRRKIAHLARTAEGN